MNRLAIATISSRPFLRLFKVLTAKLSRARVMPTYISRRSSSRRSGVISFSSLLKGKEPSFTPASTTCGHSSPLEACKVDRVTTFGSPPRSARLVISEMVWATSITLFFSVSTVMPPSFSISPPQRLAIQSMKSRTLAQRLAAIFSLSASS